MEHCVYWKPISLGDLFERETPPSTNTPAKNIKVYEQAGEGMVALITRGRTNNGVVGFIDKGSFPTVKNMITYNDQFGLALFHNYEFTTIKDHLSILRCKIPGLQTVLDANQYVYSFICFLINKTLAKSVYDFNYSPSDFRFDREIIWLPCKESADSDFIWNECGKKLVLDVEYIKYLLLRGEVERLNAE